MFIVDAEVAQAVARQAHGVVLIVNRERPRVPGVQRLDISPQDAHAEAVKRRDQRGAADLQALEQLAHPVAHFFRGLVSEGNRENVSRPDATFRDQVRDSMRNHPRLAGTGARQNQQRPVAGSHSFALLRIKLREKFSHSSGYRCHLSTRVPFTEPRVSRFRQESFDPGLNGILLNLAQLRAKMRAANQTAPHPGFYFRQFRQFSQGLSG